MKKLCLAFVCAAIGVGGWMGLAGRSSAQWSPRVVSYHPGDGGELPQPPVRLLDRGEEALELEETTVILGALVALAVVVDAVAGGSNDKAAAGLTNRHRVHASPAH